MTQKHSSRQSAAGSSAIRVALCDLNGVARGKRIPASQVDKALNGGIRLPLTASMVDIWGRDIDNCDLIFETGDADGLCRPIRDELLPAPWLGNDAGSIPVWMYAESGEPSDLDPRHALARVLDRFAERKLTPVVATELEFYLTPLNANSIGFESEGLLSIDQLDALAPLLDDIYNACELQGIPADAAISECGPGQFEVNLLHRGDAMAAADDAVLFKQLVKGSARVHGFAANFMAKPYGITAGSGLHIHFSLLGEDGKNVFDDGTELGSEVLHQALGGVLASMAESTLIFAPHHNSYRRLRPDTHAPTTVCWGYENRTAAVRIPGGPMAARRIEHRVSGADANPYLVLASVLGAAMHGIDKQLSPPSATKGNAYNSEAPQLPEQWSAAISAFEQGSIVADIFGQKLHQVFVQLKRQEHTRFMEEISPFELASYAEQV